MALTILPVLAPNSGLMTGTGTNTYLLDGEAGEVAVVDPGPAEPGHLAAIRDAARPRGRIVASLVTHGHADHRPGALALRAAVGAPVLGHPALPGVDRALVDGAELTPAAGVRLVALHTPGHTDDSVCYWDAVGGALFTGDLIAGSGTVVVDDARGGMARYVGSLRRLRQLGPCAIYPGHGPPTDDGQTKIEAYLEHRQRREREILAVLAAGPATVAAIVVQLYATVVPALAPMAARNVRAHLAKLADEGRVWPVDGLWRLAGDAEG